MSFIWERWMIKFKPYNSKNGFIAWFRIKPQQNPDTVMQNFLMGRGEFSAEAAISFDKKLARDRELKMMGAM
jgi:hypothetical protein